LVEDDPNSARNRFELGRAYYVGGQTAPAEAEWLEAMALAPHSTSPPANLALLYLDTGRPDEAADMIDSVRAIDPSASILGELQARLEAAR
jgi:Flp pilus assembly protein TadD